MNNLKGKRFNNPSFGFGPKVSPSLSLSGLLALYPSRPIKPSRPLSLLSPAGGWGPPFGVVFHLPPPAARKPPPDAMGLAAAP